MSEPSSSTSRIRALIDPHLLRQRLAASAAVFLQSYPIGAVVSGDEIVAWAHEHADGPIASDLLVGHRSQMLGSLRRHLNMGGASLPEVECFYIAAVEGERDVFVVCALAERSAR
jgi:hypothetical protein